MVPRNNLRHCRHVNPAKLTHWPAGNIAAQYRIPLHMKNETGVHWRLACILAGMPDAMRHFLRFPCDRFSDLLTGRPL